MPALPNGNLANRRWLAGLAVLGAIVSPVACADGWGGSLALSSDYVFRGLTQTDGSPSAQADLHYQTRGGWFAGARAANVKQGMDQSTSVELDGYLGYGQTLGDDWGGSLALVRYAYPLDHPSRQYDYDELVGTVSYLDRVSLTIAASPDSSIIARRGTVTNRPAFSYDLALHQPLFFAVSANAGVGYYDLHRLLGTGYFYWNLGLAYDFGRFQIDVSYIGTDAAAKSLFYRDTAGNRGVASVLWRF